MSLTLGLLADEWPFDPVLASVSAQPALAPLFQSLLYADVPGEAPRPDLALRYEVSGDGCTLRFWLREACFHDGTPVRASDVAWSLSRHVWPGSASRFASQLRGLLSRGGTVRDGELAASFVADDAVQCLTIQLAAPYVALPELLAHPAMAVVRLSSDGTLLGSGPLKPVEGECERHTIQLVPHGGYQGPRRLRADTRLQRFDTVNGLADALAAKEIDAFTVERRHYARFVGEVASTPLKERWVGTLILNAAGGLRNLECRRDLAALVQTLARESFGEWFTPFLLPTGLVDDSYFERSALPPLGAAVFAARWRTALAAEPLRIAYAPGRGPLSDILERLASALGSVGVAHEMTEVAEPQGVYALVAQGAFDVVARGWMQDFDDAEEFFGIHNKQAPGALANRHRLEFEARIASARHLSDGAARRRAFTSALIELESAWLCVPVCQDTNRIFHAPGTMLAAHGRDIFTVLAAGGAKAGAGSL